MKRRTGLRGQVPNLYFYNVYFNTTTKHSQEDVRKKGWHVRLVEGKQFFRNEWYLQINSIRAGVHSNASIVMELEFHFGPFSIGFSTWKPSVSSESIGIL